jgi:hypothetical protein
VPDVVHTDTLRSSGQRCGTFLVAQPHWPTQQQQPSTLGFTCPSLEALPPHPNPHSGTLEKKQPIRSGSPVASSQPAGHLLSSFRSTEGGLPEPAYVRTLLLPGTPSADLWVTIRKVEQATCSKSTAMIMTRLGWCRPPCGEGHGTWKDAHSHLLRHRGPTLLLNPSMPIDQAQK